MTVRIVTGQVGDPLKIVTEEGVDLTKMLALHDVQVYVNSQGTNVTLGVHAEIDVHAGNLSYQILDPRTGDWKRVSKIVFDDGDEHVFDA